MEKFYYKNINTTLLTILNFLSYKDLIKIKKLGNTNDLIFFSFDYTLNFVISNKLILKNCLEKVKNYSIMKKYLSITFFNYEIFYKYPIFKFNGNFLGESDFIDNISEDEVNYPIMVGVDNYHRPFIIIKYKLYDNSIEQYNQLIKFNKSTYLLVIFQRTEIHYNWWCKMERGSDKHLLNSASWKC